MDLLEKRTGTSDERAGKLEIKDAKQKSNEEQN